MTQAGRSFRFVWRIAAAAALCGALLPGAATAGPGHAGQVEGQHGWGPAVWSPDSGLLAATRWDRAGLWLVDAATGDIVEVSRERGAGFAPVWHGDWLYFKEVVVSDQASRSDRVVRVNAATLEREVLAEAPLAGNPSVSAAGAVAYTEGRELVIDRALGEGAPARRQLPAYCNLAVIDPAGARVAYDADDRLVVLDLERGTTWRVGPGARPAWSPDGRLLLVRGPGPRVAVFDVADRRLLLEAGAQDPVWTPGGEVLAERVVADGFDVLASDLWLLDPATGRERRVEASVDDGAGHLRYPAPSPDGARLAFVDTSTGDLLVAAFEGPALLGPALVAAPARRLPRAAPPPRPAPCAGLVDVPYMHQLWDTPDDFDGSWSCGPTSCVQTVQRYGRLPDHPMTASWPTPHDSPWGWYIPNEYEFAGFTYDIMGAAPDGYVPGAHGFICRELGAAYWDYMVAFMNQHGLTSWWAGSAFSALVTEIDAGYPMVASTNTLGYGHIMVFRGYGDDHSIVANDPYGDANAGGWGSSRNGEGVVYDWPGYNNGHVELVVSQVFGAQGTVPVEPDADADVDADADSDADADADADTDADADADEDADDDLGTELDADAPADADPDGDHGRDAEADADAFHWDWDYGDGCGCAAASAERAGAALRALIGI